MGGCEHTWSEWELAAKGAVLNPQLQRRCSGCGTVQKKRPGAKTCFMFHEWSAWAPVEEVWGDWAGIQWFRRTCLKCHLTEDMPTPGGSRG